MNYTLSTSKYIVKNFFYILPFAIIPAFFLSLSVAEDSIINVLHSLFSGRVAAWSFYDLFCAISVLNFGSWKSVITGFLGIVVILPCISVFMAFLEKHMRIGKRTYNGIFSKLNDNAISTLGYALIFIGIYEIWALLTASLLYFLAKIPIVALAYVMLSICFILMHVVLLYAIGAIYLWLPCMQITGFPMMEALQYAHQLSVPVKWNILGGQIFLLFLAEGLIGFCARCLPNGIVFTTLTTVLYVVLLLFYCVRMEIAYFERDHIERAALKKY